MPKRQVSDRKREMTLRATVIDELLTNEDIVHSMTSIGSDGFSFIVKTARDLKDLLEVIYLMWPNVKGVSIGPIGFTIQLGVVFDFEGEFRSV